MNEALLGSLVERVVDMRTRGVVTARDTYSVLDAKNSMIMLTSKVNAIAKILMDDKPESVKQAFVEAWKSEFIDLTKRKHATTRKMIDDEKFLTSIAELMGETVDEGAIDEIRKLAYAQLDEAEQLDLSILETNASLLEYDIL